MIELEKMQEEFVTRILEVEREKFLPYSWLLTIDTAYYRFREFIEKKTGLKFLVSPSPEEVKKALENGECFAVLSSLLPPEELKDSFIIEKLPNYKMGMPSQDYFALKVMTEGKGKEAFDTAYARIVERKLGIRIFKPSLNLSHLMDLKS